MIWLVLLLRFINLCAAAVVAGGQLVVLLVIVPTKKRFATRTSVEVHNAMLGHQIDSFMKPCGITSISAALVILVLNFFLSMRRGKSAGPNPWRANTLEWQTSSPPPHENFTGRVPIVYRGPYEYSVPERTDDHWPQNEPPLGVVDAGAHSSHHA